MTSFNTKRFLAVLREWIECLVIALALALFIRTFFLQAFKIPSGSMRMTLVEGDRLLVNKLRYGAKAPFVKDKRLPGFGDIKRGDVIVFVYPKEYERGIIERIFNPPKDFIKRVIALEGETVEIKYGDIYINNQLVEDAKVKNTYYYNRGDYGAVGEEVTVPEGHYFVLGDNSGSSHDSRFWGFVSEEKIIGKAEVIYWPLNRIRFIK